VRAFRVVDDALTAGVGEDERHVLTTVVADVAELLGAGRLEARAPRGDGTPEDQVGLRLRLDPLPAPDDPAVHRLLPDASREDPEVSAEFRRLTEDDLRQDKIDRLATLYAALTAPEATEEGVLLLPRAHGPRLAATLTDIRLVLADRLGLTDEEAAAALEDELDGPEPDADDRSAQVRHYLGTVYVALGWWQETLMSCLLADLDRR
jgi:hypothetical protein